MLGFRGSQINGIRVRGLGFTWFLVRTFISVTIIGVWSLE